MEATVKPLSPTKEQVAAAFDELEAATLALPVVKDEAAKAQAAVLAAAKRYEEAKKAWQLLASQVGK